MGLAFLAAGHACALGLGEAVGHAVLGEPLRIEIPLLGSGSGTPSPACFRVGPPVAEIGNDFVLRNARVDVVGERSGSRLIVTTTAAVQEPFVAFAVTAGCSFGLTRDYILLSSMPAAAPVAVPPVAAAAATQATAPATPQPEKPRTPTPAGEALPIETDVTLAALARQKYPLQPKAREKFMRMMMHANPGLTDGDSVIAAGTALQVPPGLPRRREGSPAPRTQAAAPDRAVQAAVATPPAKPDAAPSNPRKDRLVLGAAPESSEAKLLDEAERLTAILLEQTKEQEELLQNIARIEASYGALRKEFARLENQIAGMEAERKAEKLAAESPSFDVVVLLLAVLAGGALGGGALHLYQRRKAKAAAVANPPWWPEEKAAKPDASRLLKTAPAAQPSPAQADILDFHTQPADK